MSSWLMGPVDARSIVLGNVLLKRRLAAENSSSQLGLQKQALYFELPTITPSQASNELQELDARSDSGVVLALGCTSTESKFVWIVGST